MARSKELLDEFDVDNHPMVRPCQSASLIPVPCPPLQVTPPPITLPRSISPGSPLPRSLYSGSLPLTFPRHTPSSLVASVPFLLPSFLANIHPRPASPPATTTTSETTTSSTRAIRCVYSFPSPPSSSLRLPTSLHLLRLPTWRYRLWVITSPSKDLPPTPLHLHPLIPYSKGVPVE